ncbi:hypothetical protein ACJX0J_028412, partial [Zea mays]
VDYLNQTHHKMFRDLLEKSRLKYNRFNNTNLNHYNNLFTYHLSRDDMLTFASKWWFLVTTENIVLIDLTTLDLTMREHWFKCFSTAVQIHILEVTRGPQVVVDAIVNTIL